MAKTKLREDIKRKAYSDYDRQKLVTDSTLRKLQVVELNKYFRHHNFERHFQEEQKGESPDDYFSFDKKTHWLVSQGSTHIFQKCGGKDQ